MQRSREELLKVYRTMRTIRVFEDRLSLQFAAGDIGGFVHLSAGQEASAVGVLEHFVGGKDYVATTHRGHGHCIAFGSDPEKMMLEIYGRRDGLCRGKGGSIHIADIERGMLGANGIVGGGAPLCVGAALTIKNNGGDGVAAAFIGDGASNQGSVFEAMNLASVWHVPALFIYENNGYAESTGAEYTIACGDIVNRAEAFGMSGTSVDGRDFFEVSEAVGEVVAKARETGGPALIEIKLERFRGHFEGDQQTYRAPGEADDARENRDPIKIFVEKVINAGLIDAGQFTEIDAEVETLIDGCVDAAKAAPAPADDDLMSDVYLSY